MPGRNTLFVFVLLLVVGLGMGRADTEARFYRENREFHQILNLIITRYVEEVPPEKLFEGAYRGMLEQLDPYCQYFSAEEAKAFAEDTQGKFGGLGIEIGLRDGILTVITPMPDTPAWKAGVLPGDLILAIDGESTERISLPDAVKRLRGAPGTEVRLTIRHQGKQVNEDITIVRSVIEPAAVEHEIVLAEPKIGYVRIYSFNQEMLDQFERAADALEQQGVEAVILDLRGNPGGLLDAAVKLADRLLDSGVIVSVRGREDQHTWRARKDGTHFVGLPIAVLVDAGTASASEITAAALQQNGRAMVVGTNTFGKGAVQSVTSLKDGGTIKLTTARYFTPNDRPIGPEHPVEPDVVIEMSVERLLALRQQRMEDKLRGKAENGPPVGTPPPAPEEAPGTTLAKRERVRDIQLDGAVAILKAQVRATSAASRAVQAAR